MVKLVDKIKDAATPWFSFEFFPPRTEEGVENLFDRQDRMASYGPMFCDITWGAGGTTAELTLDIAAKMQNMVCVETMMHLTCTNSTKEVLDEALAKVKQQGIQNILALRGDPPKGQDKFEAVEGGFSCALDLVKYIREKHGDYFGIAVAGYPEAHPDVITDDPEKMKEAYWNDIKYLKEKVDAGGDVIVTQLFYDVEVFLQFVKDCRATGIECPIIPGIMPIMTYGGFKRMTGFCKTRIPDELAAALEEIKDNDEAVKQFGIDNATKMCQRILDSGVVPGLHMYTLNMERSAVAILENLGMIKDKAPRTLPWRQPTSTHRKGEAVRPIHWSNRPKSYLKRTAEWDKYPQGRWGDARSPAYGTLSDYQFMRRHTSDDKRREKAKAAWGAAPQTLEDVIKVFVAYTTGKVEVMPWNELGGMHAESSAIAAQLQALNGAGYLTINSQPRVNAARSDDPHVGWGGPSGYVYQKAYVEFFCSPEAFKGLQARVSNHPSITYLAVSSKGDFHSNQASADANAVTWGVFPGKEVVQPTVVDKQSFLVWKDEAFQLWTSEWGSLYEEGSASAKLISGIADSWYLVSVVDNDFVEGDLFAVFDLPQTN
mmetsp:Transcript_3439/g.9965  ORF Transcript_3439/g.9965 Transcript_3439/m.9965 type:complete len:600 (-) Transcript_3439:1135-2934(-)